MRLLCFVQGFLFGIYNYAYLYLETAVDYGKIAYDEKKFVTGNNEEDFLDEMGIRMDNENE